MARTRTTLVDPDVRFFAALADPTRLAILRELAGADQVCACDFTSCCDVRQPTVSHHLRVLREAGIIESERRGTWIYYRLGSRRRRSPEGVRGRARGPRPAHPGERAAQARDDAADRLPPEAKPCLNGRSAALEQVRRAPASGAFPSRALIGRTVSIRTSAPFFSGSDCAPIIQAASSLKSGSWPDEHRPFGLAQRRTGSPRWPRRRGRRRAARRSSPPRRGSRRRCAAVSRARTLGEVTIAPGRNPSSARNRPSRRDCFSPLLDSGRASSDPVQASGSPASAWRSR